MQATMANVTNLGAGLTNANVLTGETYEKMPGDGFLRFSITGDAAGAARVTITVGGRLHYAESPVSRQNRQPIIPDDVLMSNIPARRGDQIQVRFRNTGGAAIDLFTRVDLVWR